MATVANGKVQKTPTGAGKSKANNGSFDEMQEGDKPFNPINQDVVRLLESITPIEKASAVPRVLIWEIDPDTGKAKHDQNDDGIPDRPLSLTLVEPPKFGNPIAADQRFRERPPVSLERISVKTENPRGLISFSQLEIAFTVHRPDVIYADVDNTDRDVWASIIFPGRAHALEYGWSSSVSKNPLLNGTVYKQEPIDVEGTRQIRFVTTNYSFTILPTNEVRFVIQAIELGDFNLRQSFLVPPEDKGSPTASKGPSDKKIVKDDVTPYANNREFLNKLTKLVQGLAEDGNSSKQGKKKGVRSVKFGKLLETVFVPQIRRGLQEMNFEVEKIFVGNFNNRAGKPAKKYGGGADISGKPISEFTIPFDEIQKIFTELLKLGERLTVVNFLEPFLRIFEDPTRWDRSDENDPTEHSVPQITMRTTFRKLGNGKMAVSFYIFDVYQQYTELTKRGDESQKIPDGKVTREEIRDYVVDHGVPYISLVKVNSYIKEPNFQVVQDERIKTIFMQRSLEAKNRDQITSQTDVAAKQSTPPPDPRQIFSASIQGDIVMLGNFVFDVFQLIWIDFGVPQWDGPYNIMEREDIIELGEFVTRIKVVSNGQDPLGTQKRSSPVESTAVVESGGLTQAPLSR